MGQRQKTTMWAVGALLALAFADYFLLENPSEVSVVAELLWVSLFLLTVAAIEGALWLIFRTYNNRTKGG